MLTKISIWVQLLLRLSFLFHFIYFYPWLSKYISGPYHNSSYRLQNETFKAVENVQTKLSYTAQFCLSFKWKQSGNLTLSIAIPFGFCTFKSNMKLLISGKIPLALQESGKFPWYLPDTINGFPEERSGMWFGYSCNEEHRKHMKIDVAEQR